MSHLISPYKGSLCELLVSPERAGELIEKSVGYYSIDLLPRQLCDLELLLNGGFSPLRGFMVRDDYENVLDNLRLKDGTFWPMPVALDISEEVVKKIKIGESVALRDPEGLLLAVIHVEDRWKIDKEREVREIGPLPFETKDYYIGGRLEGIQLPVHYDFKIYRLTPAEARDRFNKLGWRRVVAFQTKNHLHALHKEMTLRAIKEADANLLLHPLVGMSKMDDTEYYNRVRCYIELSKKYPPNIAMLNLLPFAMRMAGQREALLHGIISRNYGCTHFMIEPPNLSHGESKAQDLFKTHQEEIGVKMITFTIPISDVELSRRLSEGLEIPDWFSYPEVIQELRKSYPPKHKQGITIFLTGLSGAGKSTIANVLLTKFLEMGGRPVTLLDGDIVRKHLSSELGFSREHRDLNIMRIGFVAGEITKNGGIAICAPIAPYIKVREYNRRLISRYGKYVEVYVSTPLEICESRDRKGLYAKARAGLIKGFTGIDDPYETPESPEIVIDTTDITPEEAAQEILLYLENNGYIK